MPNGRIVDGMLHFGPGHVLRVERRHTVERLQRHFTTRAVPFYCDKKEDYFYFVIDDTVDLKKLASRFSFVLED